MGEPILRQRKRLQEIGQKHRTGMNRDAQIIERLGA